MVAVPASHESGHLFAACEQLMRVAQAGGPLRGVKAVEALAQEVGEPGVRD